MDDYPKSPKSEENVSQNVAEICEADLEVNVNSELTENCSVDKNVTEINLFLEPDSVRSVALSNSDCSNNDNIENFTVTAGYVSSTECSKVIAIDIKEVENIPVLEKDKSVCEITDNNSPSIVNDGDDNLQLSEVSEQEELTKIEQSNDILFDKGHDSSSVRWKYNFMNIPMISKTKEVFGTENYLNGCKWSPDGSCLLTNCSDFKLRIFDLPQTLYSIEEWDCLTDPVDFNVSLKISEGGLIYDFDWYPFMSSWEPATCCIICTSFESPIHLWDAFTGQLRATYKAYDYADEVHAATSLAFSPTGDKIYSGFINEVKVFNTAVPGRQCTVFDIKKICGQRGIVSCIAENPCIPEIFAVGTYSKSIGLYTNSKECVCILSGQKSGLTQIKFATDGLKLYSGSRMDNEILCWDLRSPGRVLHTVQREVSTNQRIYFDFTDRDKYLLSGGTDGLVRIWDLDEVDMESDCSEVLIKEKCNFKAHNDCTNAVSVNRHYPILATSSGKKHYPSLDSDDETNTFFINNISKYAENSVKLWWIGPRKEDEISEVSMDVQEGPQLEQLCSV